MPAGSNSLSSSLVQYLIIMVILFFVACVTCRCCSNRGSFELKHLTSGSKYSYLLHREYDDGDDGDDGDNDDYECDHRDDDDDDDGGNGLEMRVRSRQLSYEYAKVPVFDDGNDVEEDKVTG